MEIQANQAKAGMIVLIPANGALRKEDLLIRVSRDVRYGSFQSWDDASCYIHGQRSDGATYPLWVYDLLPIRVVGYHYTPEGE